MKLNFRHIEIQNFLSIGANPVSIKLDSCPLTLTRGANGVGKTGIQTSISFALFGKTTRGINKPQLVNSINKKDCLVKLLFDLDGDEYLIIRGLKPNVFEIHKNDVLIDQHSSVHDYQTFLEKRILGFDFHAFHQIVSLSATSYTPFMLLSAAQRREIIEELLDISIFSRMKKVLKEKILNCNNQIGSLAHDLSLMKQEFRHAKELNAVMSAKHAERRDEIDELISQKQETLIEIRQTRLDPLEQRMNELDTESRKYNENELKKTLNSLMVSKTRLTQSINESSSGIEFFSEKGVCPTCEQDIDQKKAERMIDRHKKNIHSNNGLLEEMNEVEKSIRSSIDKMEKLSDEWNQLFGEKQIVLHEISSCEKEISRLQKEFIDLVTRRDLIEKSDSRKESLIAKEIVDLSNQKDAQHEMKDYYELIETFLKDKDGIKSFMISQYIPKINQILNEYLQKFNFFVSFTFDENFNEIIKSRHRDLFTYDSFSAGQQARIDLSILFVWREIAKMRNSIQTNLLILDEVFDSSLDQEGEEQLIEILKNEAEVNDTNVFIISHSEGIKGMEFDRELVVTKPREMFTEIHETVLSAA